MTNFGFSEKYGCPVKLFFAQKWFYRTAIFLLTCSKLFSGQIFAVATLSHVIDTVFIILATADKSVLVRRDNVFSEDESLLPAASSLPAAPQ